MRLWTPFIAPSLKQLHEDNRAKNQSLGIIRPDAGSLKFFSKPAKDAEDRDVAEPAFGYRYTSSGKSHEHIIHDWEVQEAYWQYKRRYSGQALEQLVRMYGEKIPTHNLHFIMGTRHAHPRTFIVIGLLRSGLDPAELAKQSDLFK